MASATPMASLSFERALLTIVAVALVSGPSSVGCFHHVDGRGTL